MKIHFYGTGASEGVPALFCECEYCRKIRAAGGKNFRMRSCTQIDEELLIDFSMDGYGQMLFRGLDLTAIRYMLITHSHEDHLYPPGIIQIEPPMAYYDRKRMLQVYGNETVVGKIRTTAEQIGRPETNLNNYLEICRISSFQTVSVGEYEVTALPAEHDKKEECFVYVVKRNGRTLFYGHDSGIFCEETWDAMRHFHFDGVVLDCTMVDQSGIFPGHMGLPDNIKVRQRMIEEGMAGDKTKFICTHFVHSLNPLHERIWPLFAEKGFIAAYDGLEVEI